jgi:hypothetical protein
MEILEVQRLLTDLLEDRNRELERAHHLLEAKYHERLNEWAQTPGGEETWLWLYLCKGGCTEALRFSYTGELIQELAFGSGWRSPLDADFEDCRGEILRHLRYENTHKYGVPQGLAFSTLPWPLSVLEPPNDDLFEPPNDGKPNAA